MPFNYFSPLSLRCCANSSRKQVSTVVSNLIASAASAASAKREGFLSIRHKSTISTNITREEKYLKNKSEFKTNLVNNSSKLSSLNRIGPHNIDILSIIIGSTLGDTQLEERKNGIGTRVIFELSNKNVEYLMWFHSYLSIRGYCNPEKPKLQKRIKKNNEITFHFRIISYTYYSFN